MCMLVLHFFFIIRTMTLHKETNWSVSSVLASGAKTGLTAPVLLVYDFFLFKQYYEFISGERQI